MVSWKSLGKDLSNGWKKAGDTLTGTSKDAGALGLGQYKGSTAKIDETAFTDRSVTDGRRTEFANALAQNQAMKSPEMRASQISGGDQAAVRGQQSDFLNTLKARADGKGGPSAAELQMNRGLDQAVSNARAQAASARGISPAAAMRMAMTTGATAQQDIAGQAAILRAQEQAQAVDQYGNQMGNIRTQDLDLAGRNAELGQNAAQTNLQAQIQSRGLQNEQDRFLREGQMTMDERDRQASMDLGKLRTAENTGLAGVNSGAYQAASTNRQGFIGGLAGGLLASDERVKKNVAKVKITGREKVDKEDKEGEKDFSKALVARSDGPPPSYLAGEGIGKIGGKAYDSYTKEPETIGSMMTPQSAPTPKKLPQGLAMSDEKTKKGKAESDPKSFLDALTAYTYQYKDPEKAFRGEGPQYGVMAQDLEKTPIGKSMVKETPEGKVVDYAKAGGAMLATAASLNDRMSDIEKAFQARKKRSA